jgi:beta-lactamase class A
MSLLVLLLISSPVFSSNSVPALETCRSNRLQEGLETCLRDLHLDKSVERKKLSIALVDITDPSRPLLAEVNGNRMMYAASLPKIAILLGAFERIERGEMELDRETEEKLTRMIRNSSNKAATDMLNRVGKAYLADLLQSPKYRLYDPSYNGGLWVGKDYGRAGAWKRDPLANLSHGATAFQVARFYYMLESGQLVSPEMSREMKSILGKPAIQHKFVKGLKSRPDAVIYRKSGSWRQYHADSAIIEHNGRRYIAVALAEDSQGGAWLSQLIARLDDLILQSPSS